MVHNYNVEVAVEYGIEEAILINHFAYWIADHAANGTNLHDGRYWTFDTAKALCSVMPEFKNEKRITYLINKLVEQDIIMKGNYNKLSFDRTLWFTFTDKGIQLMCDNGLASQECLAKIVESISQYSGTHFPNLGNAIPKSEVTIPHNKTTHSKTTNNKTPNISPSIPQGEVIEELSQEKILFEEFRKAYLGTKRGLDIEFTNFCKKHKDWRDVLPYLKVNYERQIEAKKSQRGSIDPRFEKHLQTYINQRCWEEEISYGSNTHSTNHRHEAVSATDKARQRAIETLRANGYM
jgi:hypothetical protein